MPQMPLFLEIPRHLNDERIDWALAQLLQEKFPERTPLSRAQCTKAINEGQVTLNGKMVPARSLVATHDKIALAATVFEDIPMRKPFSGKVDVTVLDEEESFLVLNKGAGVQMYQAGQYTGATVVDWLLAHYPDIKGVGEDALRPGIVHRLDRDTSGVLAIAKNQTGFQALKKAFHDRLVDKTYVALVYGHLKELEGSIDAPLIRRPGELRRRAIDPERYEGELPGNARTALTEYRVMARYADYDLVLATPRTGRTHQIRVHLAYLGHPVVGDRLYAFKDVKRKGLLFPKRHLLHAWRLKVPFQGKRLKFQAPLPEDFLDTLRHLDETRVSSYDGEALKSLF